MAEFINLIDKIIQNKDSNIFEIIVEYYNIINKDNKESKLKEEIIKIILISKALDIIKLWNL